MRPKYDGKNFSAFSLEKEKGILFIGKNCDRSIRTKKITRYAIPRGGFMLANKEIAIIYARSLSRNIIGVRNSLPWAALPEELRFFREKTENNVIIMGRRTFESLGLKPLRNRVNVVISRTLPAKITRLKMYASQDGAYYRVHEYDQAEYSVPVYIFSRVGDVMNYIFSVNGAEREDKPDFGRKDFFGKNVFFIGGVDIFKDGYPYCGRVYETLVDKKIEVEKDFISYNVHDEEGFERDFVLVTRERYYDKAQNIPFEVCSYAKTAGDNP
jgi:dihydrofolate reductase